ncbi:unnamed protein product [Bemisia tabaci]|uniref:Uncharacterized protein n=1 Tax=Bemisia tabaci TaxID=7038 RepID=A0A9P0AIK4_BEMTA|nr:unnamed protein product [Bemisia tabaci]
MFPTLKKELRGRRFVSKTEIQNAIQNFFHSIPEEEFRETMLDKWQERMKKCIRFDGRVNIKIFFGCENRVKDIEHFALVVTENVKITTKVDRPQTSYETTKSAGLPPHTETPRRSPSPSPERSPKRGEVYPKDEKAPVIDEENETALKSESMCPIKEGILAPTLVEN